MRKRIANDFERFKKLAGAMQSDQDLLQRMAAEIGLLPHHLVAIVKTAPIRYKTFFIPKKSGGMREVAQPAREVKAIQRWLLRDLQLLLPVHEAATAYRIGTSIKTNAQVHASSRYMLKMDFQDFFPSIVRSDIYAHLERYCSDNYDASARKLISYVCCWAKERQPPLRLCIGAPSSPALSNSVMYDFDCKLGSIANSEGVTYSRYADDITLSCQEKNKLDRFVGETQQILAELSYPRIKLNETKTVRASKAGKRVVTGLLITPEGNISIGRSRKRLIRSMYHNFLLGRLSPNEVQKLKGLLAFADNIEPGYSLRLRPAKA